MFLRYKMENLAYQDSPLSFQRCGTSLHFGNEEYNIVNKMDELVVTKEADVIDDTEYDDDDVDIESHAATNQDVTELSKTQLPTENRKRKKWQVPKRKQSLRKTALFKSYVDENSDSNKNIALTPKRTPLSTKNCVLFSNENVCSSTKKCDVENAKVYRKNKDEFQKAKRNIALRHLSATLDKENVQF